MYNKYDIIYSLGSGCGCAMIMDHARLRSFAGPFDWIRSDDGSFDKSFMLIMNGFADFFNLEDLRLRIESKPVDPLCHAYENVRTGYIFFHDFPKGLPMEESFATVKKKYERRIERFNKMISERRRVLLIWYSFTGKNTSDEIVLRHCGELCRKMKKKIDFLIIEHTEGLYCPLKRQIADNIVRYNCHTKPDDPDDEKAWLGNFNLVYPLFAQYQLCIPWMTVFKYNMAKLLIRFVSAFIITKDTRKLFRERMFNKFKIPESNR